MGGSQAGEQQGTPSHTRRVQQSEAGPSNSSSRFNGIPSHPNHHASNSTTTTNNTANDSSSNPSNNNRTSWRDSSENPEILLNPNNKEEDFICLVCEDINQAHDFGICMKKSGAKKGIVCGYKIRYCHICQHQCIACPYHDESLEQKQ